MDTKQDFFLKDFPEIQKLHSLIHADLLQGFTCSAKPSAEICQISLEHRCLDPVLTLGNEGKTKREAVICIPSSLFSARRKKRAPLLSGTRYSEYRGSFNSVSVFQWGPKWPRNSSTEGNTLRSLRNSRCRSFPEKSVKTGGKPIFMFRKSPKKHLIRVKLRILSTRVVRA